MEAPILDFFDEQEVTNSKKYNISTQIDILKQYKINTALFVFTHEIHQIVEEVHLLEDFYEYRNASGIYKCFLYDKKFIIAISPVGAPSAAMMMEVLGFMGITNFFACGSSGQISEDLDSTKFFLVEKAIRSEGVSYHYLKPSIYANTTNQLTNHIANFLSSQNISFERGIVWTTDSFFRETRSEISLRNSQGAKCVDMECASWCAIAEYRKFNFAQLLYFSDTISNLSWKLNVSLDEVRKNIINLMIKCVELFAS